MAKKFLTLNIGAATVELAEYEAGSKGAMTLLNYGAAALVEPVDAVNADTVLTPALLEIVREKGIKPGKVAVSVSGQMVFPRLAAITPAGGEEKFEQQVRFEIEQNIPFPIDEMVCDRQVVGDLENGDKLVLIVAAKVDQIEAITAAVAAAGFTPELVDVAPLAITNALYAARPAEVGGCMVILDIGAKTTSLVIAEGDRIYNRSIPVAGNAITKEIATALGCSVDEAEAAKIESGYVSMGGVTEDDDETADRISKVCRVALTRLNAEISRSINFYRSQQGGGTPAKLYLTGGTANLPQIDVFFAESLGVEVEFFNPFETVSVGPKVDVTALEREGAQLASTVGTALNFAGLAAFSINLLPPSLVEARKEKARIPFVIAAGAAAAAGLALVMLAVGHDTEVVIAQRDAVQRKVDTMLSFDRKIKAADEKLAAAREESAELCRLMLERSAAVRRLNAVRSSLLPGMWIEKWEGGRIAIRYWKDKVKAVPGKTAGELVAEKLGGRPFVEKGSVKIADMSTIGKHAQVAQFTLEVRFK